MQEELEETLKLSDTKDDELEKLREEVFGKNLKSSKNFSHF